MFENIVTFQARYRPDAVAITTSTGSVTFGALDADVNRVARKLADIAPRGARVAVQVAGSGLHWVMLLALARLGCVTASLPLVGERSEADLVAILRPDLLLTEREHTVTEGRCFHLAPDWLQETFRSPSDPIEPYAFSPDDVVRVVMSSGTTGRPKKMALTRRMVDARIRTGGLSQMGHRRIHAAVGLDTETGFRAPLVAWATGLPVLYPQAGFRWADFLLTTRPQALVLVPAQLDGLLASLPHDFPVQSDLRLILVSGALSGALFQKARAKLSQDIYVTYGSTEAGLAAQASPTLLSCGETLTGVISPSAAVEVVDDYGAQVPWGNVGRVRVRTEEMVAGYLDDDALTAQFFKDGWFYPGDLGALSATGRLTVQGREAEILDLGGLRIAPDVIEAALLSCYGVRDAAAFSVASAEGVHQPRAAVVCEGACDLDAVKAQLRQALPQLNIPLVVMGAIPRSERGKIDREAVRREVVLLAYSRTGSVAH
jgi:acyl-CoA synthetase (AMP-forming)/AMP-acid ligase II